MAIIVHCPSCHRALRVPKDIAGQKAICPACRQPFVVPDLRDLSEKTFFDKMVSQEPASAQSPGNDLSLSDDEIASIEKFNVDVSPPAPPPPSESPQESPPDSPPPPAQEENRLIALKQVAPALPPPRPAAQRSKPRPVEPPRRIDPDKISDQLSQKKSAAKQYSHQLHASTTVPHLIVLECSLAGVRFAFDSVWLAHTGFRTSMPVLCAVTGMQNRSQLLARPLAFYDQSHGKILGPRPIESAHEQHLISSQSTRQLIKTMGVIDGLVKPFSAPMPYYIAAQQPQESLQCMTHSREDDGITCQVIIPNGACAMEWLGRVNGVCGRDYELLEADIALAHSDSWKQLPEKTRARIGAWCAFAPGEQFVMYLNDADFGACDAGLGGLVITDTRLVFHKYHHHGQVLLTDEAVLLVRYDKDFGLVTLQTANNRTRVGKYRCSDLESLVAVLEHVSALKMKISEKAQPQTGDTNVNPLAPDAHGF